MEQFNNKYEEIQTNALRQRNLIRYLTIKENHPEPKKKKKKKGRDWIIENVIKKRIKRYIQYLLDRYLFEEQSVKYWKATAKSVIGLRTSVKIEIYTVPSYIAGFRLVPRRFFLAGSTFRHATQINRCTQAK